MANFANVRDALLRHLPTATTGALVTIGADGVHVAAPGVSIGDLALMLNDLSGTPDFLPDGLPIADIRLLRLDLTENADGEAALAFTIVWERASLAVADRFPVTLEKAEVDFSLSGDWLYAMAQVVLAIDAYKLAVTFELPSQMLEFQLDPAKPPDGTLDFLTKSGIIGQESHDTLTIKTMVIRGSLLFQRLMIYLELENLFTIGPVTLKSAWGEAVIAGEASSMAAGAAIVIAVPGHSAIEIDVEGEVDAQGWRLAGSLEVADPSSYTIGDLVDAVAGAPNQAATQLPPAIRNVGLKRLAIAIDTHDASFSLDCTLAWKDRVELVVHLEKSGGRVLVTGSLVLAEATFKLAFESGAKTVLVASYDAAGSTPLTLAQILEAVTGSDPLDVVDSGVSLAVVSAALALDGSGNALFAAEVDAGIDLSRLGDLPLVGSLLPKGEPLGLRIEPYYKATKFAAEAEVRPLLPASLALPATLSDGIYVAAALRLGGAPIVLDAVGGASPAAGSGVVATAGPPAVAGVPAAAAPAAAAGADVTWTKVDRALGPLKIARVGYAIDKSMVDLAIDASLEIAGLTISVDGLGVQYAFDTRALTTRLRGLGLDLKQDPLRIGGAFLNAGGDFAGSVVIGTKQFTLSAIGAFGMLAGIPSMFAYGVLDVPIGGPAFFYLEGLSAGFGLHRRLLLPKVDEIRSFPLVATAGVPMLKPGGTSAGKASPGDVLATLHDFVQPVLGEYFLAVGIKFNSFRLLHGFALLVVSVGPKVAIDLIGTATYASPPDLPAGIPALAYVELDVHAHISPEDGTIAIKGDLNPSSYVYSPLCHVSGQFAFYAWSTGDFVLSLGGYHPDYHRPPEYPLVRQVELKFQVTPEVYLKGDGYFAMTPAIMMAGGGLHAQVEIGSLRASADFTADFWVAWEPFHYDAQVHLDVRAEWGWFHTSASADLHIWGPEFSGIAHVDWFVFSFDVAFGAQTPPMPQPISVAKFKKSFLDVSESATGVIDAESANRTVGVVLSGGLLGPAGDVPTVSAAELKITTSSRVPAIRVMLGTTALAGQVPTLGIAPSAVAVDVSDHGVLIELADGMGTYKDISDQFKATPAMTKFPAALWGTQAAPNQDAKMIDAVSGVGLEPRVPPAAGHSVDRAVQAFTFHNTTRSGSISFKSPAKSAPPICSDADLALLGLDPAQLVRRPPPATQAAIRLAAT